jgi:hypothetical protein
MAKICRSAIVALLLSATANANPSGDETRSDASALTFSSVATHRFVASHGRKAVLMGYPETGLEFLAYPLQIVSGYQIGFKPEGAATETDARLLLSRVTATPDSVTRIYAGPDYVVRETMFVPLERAASFLTYEVDSAHPVDIVVHFTPVLDLMWPAALGGQSTRWNDAASAYVLTEPAHGFTALIGSAQTVAHDSTVNSTLHADGKVTFSIRPQRRRRRQHIGDGNGPDRTSACESDRSGRREACTRGRGSGAQGRCGHALPVAPARRPALANAG